MDHSIMTETLTSVTSQGLGFAKLLRKSSNYISLSDSTDQPSPATCAFQTSGGMLPLDALAPPPVKSNCVKTRPRTLLRRKRKTKRISFYGDDGDDAADDGAFLGDDGSFTGGFGFYDGGSGGAGGSGGGERWNFGGNNWDDSSWWWSGSGLGSNFAFDFIYEVIYWIALSNCMHFAFKRVVRTAADGRLKVPVRLAAVY